MSEPPSTDLNIFSNVARQGPEKQPFEPCQKPISFAMSLGYAYAGACALLTRTQCYLTREQ